MSTLNVHIGYEQHRMLESYCSDPQSTLLLGDVVLQRQFLPSWDQLCCVGTPGRYREASG